MLPCTLRSPRSPHTHPRPIPTELLDSVLDHFAASSTALSSFSRVSRAWKHSCYRILFHTIRFKDGPDSDRIYAPNSIPARVLVSTERCPLAPRFDDLLAFLQGAPDVCVHVKQLYLVGTCTPGAILSSSQSGLRLDVLQRVLLMLPKVQVLSLHFLHLLPAIPWSFLRTPTVEVPAFTFGTAADYVSAADEDEDSDAMDTDTDPTPTSQSWPDTLVCRMKLRRLHIGYLDSPPSDASGVVHVLDLLDLFDAIQELNLDCMLIPERALRFALPRARNDSSASASSLSSNTNATQSAGPSLTRRLTPLRVSSLVFGEHCSPTVISLLVNVMLRLLQPDVLSSLDVQLARNSSRFISDILPDLSGFLRCAVRNLRSFTCDISGGRYLRPDAAIAVNDELVRSALTCCSHLEVVTLFLVIRADGASHAACKRGWNSAMNLLWSASGASRLSLSRINIALLACDGDGDYCPEPEKRAFLENVAMLDWARVDMCVERCEGGRLRYVVIKAVDGPYRKKGSFEDSVGTTEQLGLEVEGVVSRRVSERTRAMLKFL